jgi:hypothetical protein
MMIIPLVILDVFIEVYHHICFPLYGIPLVKRSNYIKIDRHKLEYLTPMEKIDCAYCGYANGLLHYSAEIAGRTEKYWCGIKHKEEKDFVPPKHHENFVEYGDRGAFEKRYPRPQTDVRGIRRPLDELLDRVLKGVLSSK